MVDNGVERHRMLHEEIDRLNAEAVKELCVQGRSVRLPCLGLFGSVWVYLYL